MTDALDTVDRIPVCGTDAAGAAAPPHIGCRRRVSRVRSAAVVTRRVAVPEPGGRVDEPPASALAAVEPPVPRVVEELEDRAGAGVHAGIRDDEDHLLVALVTGAERTQVVGVERPETGVDDPLGRVGCLLPLVLLHVRRPPQVKIGQRHLRRALRHPSLRGIAISVRGRPRRRQIRFGFGQILNDRLMDLLDRGAHGSRVGLLLRRQQQWHAVVHFGQPQIRVRPQELGLGEIVRFCLRVRCHDRGALGKHEVRARDHRVRRVPIASGEARAGVPGDEVRALSIEVRFAIVGAGLVGRELGRGPIGLALQPPERVVSRNCGAVQVSARLVEGVGGRESLRVLDQQIGARRRQPDGERDQGNQWLACHGSSLLSWLRR